MPFSPLPPADMPNACLSRRLMLRGAALAGLAMLAGCGTPPPPATFDLAAPRDGLTRGRGVGTMVVMEPVALQAYEDDKIIVRGSNGALSILGGAQWADRLPKLIQVRIVQTFENASRFRQVGYPSDRLNPTYTLVSEIRRFEVEQASREAVVELSVKFVRSGSGDIAGGRIFSAREPVASIDGPGAAVALQRALGDVLRQIAAFKG
jgi:cholesterol transport system auxiliary component